MEIRIYRSVRGVVSSEANRRERYTCALGGIIDIYIFLQIVSLAFSERIYMIETMDRNIFISHGFDLSPEESALFEKFLALFTDYNSHTNLSAIRDEDGIIEKHFVDSLYGASIIGESKKENLRLLDIGSG